MLKALLDANVASVRRRIAQGDCPVEPALSVETLEHMVRDLADAADQAASVAIGAGEVERVAVAKALARHPDSSWDDYEWEDMASFVRERFLEQADLALAALAPASASIPADVEREGCVGSMTPERATYFLERFKREEKWLGPHEQWALDYTIAVLAARPSTVEREGER